MRGHGDARRKGNVVRPPGLQHSQLLAASLRRALSDLTEPWNEEDYGWEFLGNRRPERPSGMSLPLEDAERCSWKPVGLAVHRIRLPRPVSPSTHILRGGSEDGKLPQDVRCRNRKRSTVEELVSRITSHIAGRSVSKVVSTDNSPRTFPESAQKASLASRCLARL